MKFIAATILAFATAIMAAPSGGQGEIFIRQDFVVDTQDAAMTDKQGNVVPFNAANVNQANTDAGL